VRPRPQDFQTRIGSWEPQIVISRVESELLPLSGILELTMSFCENTEPQWR
jgi:hypothetical protein